MPSTAATKAWIVDGISLLSNHAKTKLTLFDGPAYQPGCFFADRKSAILDSIRIDAVGCYSD